MLRIPCIVGILGQNGHLPRRAASTQQKIGVAPLNAFAAAEVEIFGGEFVLCAAYRLVGESSEQVTNLLELVLVPPAA